MRKFSFGLAAIAMVAGTACVALAANPPPVEGGNMMAPAKGQLVFKFNPIGGGTQKGTVTLVPMGEKTKVTISLTGEPEGAIEPSHFHKGNCAHPGAVTYPLTDVVAGSSVTVVNAPISKLAIAGDSVNVHKSAAQLNVYMACADLGNPPSM
ncbi:MAG TPA: hypothetical protein VKF82_02435 [Candidatus Eremiobacteraceae bacterium]|nr:hypothetical protein [Candidatus Eremiobacteraceae bacterium]